MPESNYEFLTLKVYSGSGRPAERLLTMSGPFHITILDFLVVLRLFGVNSALISFFLSFKALKAKKAASVAGNSKLQMRKFKETKILL